MSQPSILAETEHWLVLDKPAGMHVVARKDDAEGASVEAWLRAQHPELDSLEEAGLVHRLDFGTSGCLLVARSAEEQARQRSRMRDGAVRKIYQALVTGGIPRSGRFRFFFSSRYKRSKKVTVTEAGDPRTAGKCSWQLYQSTTGLWLLEIELRGAGRRHQVRAGFAHMGAPLVGDTLYGGEPWSEDRPALHAWQLHVDGVSVESPSPLEAAITPVGD